MQRIGLAAVYGGIAVELGLIGMVADWCREVPDWFALGTRVLLLAGAVALLAAIVTYSEVRREDARKDVRQQPGGV